jgi:hypothetical protein
MDFRSVVSHPTADPTASRLCNFGVVEVLHCEDVWRWRCLAIHEPAWSKATFTTMMDAYQGAAFAAYP